MLFSKKAGTAASSGKVNTSVTKGKEGDYARLQAKDPSTWASHEVGMWLEIIDLAEYTIPFIENSVGGAELFDLTDEDLVSMHITKLGHRKKLLKAIQSLNSKPKKSQDDDERSSKDSAKHSGSGTRDSFPSADAPGSSSKINVKCFYGNDTRAITVKNSITVNKLKRKIKEEFGKRMTIKYKDSDGDLISIRKDADLKNAVRGSGGRGLKLFLNERARTTISRSETGVLETLVDAVVIMDKHCGVLFMNKAAERVFGYDRVEVIGQNVKMLMPSTQATIHDEYVNSYIRTGEAKIIGKGRKVVGKKKDGSTVMLQLAVSENRSDGRHTFTGTMQEIAESVSSSTTTSNIGGGLTLPQSAVSYAILQNLLDVVIVIDEKGVIQFMNTQALKMFGYNPTEVFGKNVKQLMPDQYRNSHDQYLTNYMTTSQPKVIGKGRDVLAQHKDGSIIPVNLTVTEQKVSEHSRVFTGILRKVEEEEGRVQAKSVLQQDREVLESLVVPAIIIDEKGAIQAFNKPSQELFGFTMEEVLGKNVKLLMPSPDKEKHDAYIKAYLTSGKAKVIGTGRDVVAQHKTGALIPVRLSVTVRNDGNKKLFTGVLQKLDRS